jgi:hypothetical protein
MDALGDARASDRVIARTSGSSTRRPFAQTSTPSLMLMLSLSPRAARIAALAFDQRLLGREQPRPVGLHRLIDRAAEPASAAASLSCAAPGPTMKMEAAKAAATAADRTNFI